MRKKKYAKLTKHKYKTDEVVSALQKTIRRGKEEEACYWARELMESGLDAVLWKRLKVIAAEDCMSNMQVFMYAVQAEKVYAEIDSKSDDAKLIALAVVINLCRSLKDRTADDMLCYFVKMENKGKRLFEIPDYARDGHTEAGRKMGRADSFFWKESAKLDKEDKRYNKKYINYFRKSDKEMAK